MNRQEVKGTLLVLILIASALAPASVPVLRKSPEFIIYESSGKTTLLSSLIRGKVVVIEFMFVSSPHCLRLAQLLNKIQGDMGSRGFQPVGVVFDPPHSANAGVQSTASLVDYFKLTYPVGYSAKADVDSYLGRTGNEILNIPQIVVIDRSGMIRATSGGAGGDPKLEDENSLRGLIDHLLNESQAAASPKE